MWALVAGFAMAASCAAADTPAAGPDAPEGCAWRVGATASGPPMLLCRTASGDLVPAKLPPGFDPQTMAAARAADPKAMTALGRFYLRGPSAQHNDAEAALWFHRAADHGDPDAMVELGRMIGQRRGLPQDRSTAVQWRSLPSADDLMLAYPIEAAAADVTGEAMLRCRLGADHVPHGCSILWERPVGYGFGAAGLTLADRFQLNEGLPEGALINLPIRFELDQANPPRKLVDQCAAYAIALTRDHSLSGAADWQARYWIARSRHAALAEGEPDARDRLAGAIAADAALIASGKDRSFFGLSGRCSL